MVIKLYISGISGNKEVKKKQQRVQMILDSKQIDYEAIDITEPGKEKDKEFMQQNGKVRESLGKHPLPPQIFNDEDFCGDYEDFDLANEVDELEKFLHIETSAKDSETESKEDEDSKSLREKQNAVSVDSIYNPYEYHTFKIKYDDVNGLKEEIIGSNDMTGENIETEVTKSEVNGEHEAPLEPSENVEKSADENVAPEKEESSTQGNEKSADNDEKENEENVDEKQDEKNEEEATDEGEKQREIENPKEEKIEDEETSPPSEEEAVDDKEEKEEEKEEEKDEKEESDEESPQSEKSQED